MRSVHPGYLSTLLLFAVARAWAAPDAGAPVRPRVEKTTEVSLPSRTEVTGCLARGGSSSRAKRSAGSQTATGIVVQHDFRHACCLQGRVATTVSGSHIDVVETLSGKPCRCLCTSGLRTTIPLRPGTYHLSVWLEERGARQRITAPDLRIVVRAGPARVISLGDGDEVHPHPKKPPSAEQPDPTPIEAF